MLAAPLARKVGRWGSLGAGLLIAALYANSAAYSAWVAGGPPTPAPAAWLQRAFAHACFGGVASVVGVATFLVLCPRSRTRAAVMLGALAALFLLLPSARVFLLKDKCLNSGGRFDAVTFVCRR